MHKRSTPTRSTLSLGQHPSSQSSPPPHTLRALLQPRPSATDAPVNYATAARTSHGEADSQSFLSCPCLRQVPWWIGPARHMPAQTGPWLMPHVANSFAIFICTRRLAPGRLDLGPSSPCRRSTPTCPTSIACQSLCTSVSQLLAWVSGSPSGSRAGEDSSPGRGLGVGQVSSLGFQGGSADAPLALLPSLD